MIEVVHIVARVTTDMTRFNAGMASMEAKAKTTTAKMSLAGMRMTKYLTLPIAAVGYASVKAAATFQSSMTKIQTQAGASAADIPRIKKAILDMSGRDVSQGPKDLADSYYHLQSVFGQTVSVAKKLRMLKEVGHLAQIGGSSMEDTSSAVAGILRTHLKGATKIEQVVKTINGIVGSGNMRMPEFVESTGTAVLQVARLLGMSLKQVGAAEAVFTDENMNANMSMTRLRTSLMMAVNPSDAARKKMEQLGISSLAIGVKMRSKNGFANTLDYLSGRYDAYVKKLEGQGKSAAAAKTLASGLLFGSFGGSKGASVWATLVQQHEMYHQKIAQITEKEKKYDKDLAASNATMSVKFRMAWSRIQVALIHFGDALAPVVLGAAKAIAKLADAFSSLPRWAQKWIMGVALGLATLGPGLIIASSLFKIFKDIGMLFGVGGEVALGMGSILPIAIIAAVGALVYFMIKSKTFRDWVKSWAKQVGGFFNWLGKEEIGPFFFRIYNWFAKGGKASRWSLIVIPALKAVGHAFKVIGKDIAKILKKIVGAISEVIKKGQQLANWSHGFGEGLAGVLGAGEGKPDTPKDAFLRAMDLAHGKHQMKLYNRLRQQAIKQGYIHPHPHHLDPAPHPGSRKLQSHHDGPLVHIGEMHVRHESDAEIVAARIHRRVVTR